MSGPLVVGATVASWKCDGTELDWLSYAEHMLDSWPDVRLFVAAETLPDGREDAFGRLWERLRGLPHECWTFHLRDNEPVATTENRLARICAGRNLVREYALRNAATHCLFLDSDLTPDPDSIPKLADLDRPLAGGDVPSYCLGGPRVFCRCGTLEAGPNLDHRELPCAFPYKVEEHWNTAGYLLVRQDALRDIAWRHEWYPPGIRGNTDDPCFAVDAERAGWGRCWVRKDVVGHHPALVAVERRTGDRSLV